MARDDFILQSLQKGVVKPWRPLFEVRFRANCVEKLLEHRLDFRRSLESGLCSFFIQTAAGNRAYAIVRCSRGS